MQPQTLYLLTRAVMGFCFRMVWVTGAIYFLRVAGLDPLQLVLVGTVLELAVFLGEIPTGVLADAVSRKWSVVVGCALIGVGFYLQGAVPVFATILLAQVIWGVGFTFTSGAHDAWLADEIGAERLGDALLRGAAWHQAAAFVGIFVSVALADLRLDLPLRLSGVVFFLLAIFLAVCMRETGFRPIPKAESVHTFTHLLTTFREGVRATRARRWLVTLMIVVFCGGLASEGYDRLWEAHLLDRFELPALGGLGAIYWFALIHAVAMVLTVASTHFARRWETLDHLALGNLFAALSIVAVLSAALFALSPLLGGAVAGWIVLYVVRHTAEPLFAAWVNRDLPSRVRATVLSTVNQMNAVGQVIGGPLLGAVALRWSLRAALLLASLVLTPTPWLYRRAAQEGICS